MRIAKNHPMFLILIHQSGGAKKHSFFTQTRVGPHIRRQAGFQPLNFIFTVPMAPVNSSKTAGETTRDYMIKVGTFTIAISMCNLHGTSFRDFQVEKSSKCSQQHHLRLGKTFHSFQHVVYIQRVVGLGIFSEPLNRTTGTPKPTIVEKWMDVW